ncbi:MAG: site-specific DNA-methyltransferase [Clostridia bacterium]|nr:site-specific DNA-methyltransferase [Clostridia bacterium]
MAIKYIPFFPEPIEGQAILDNFKRTLRYKGANDLEGKLRRGMPLYEMEKQETVGDNKDGNLVIRGECISACAYLREQGIKVDLVYIDPPFASGADYAKKVYIRRNPKVAEAIAKAEEELDVDNLKVFEEKMYGDVWDKEKYLNWMYENLVAIKSVMSETASIYVHLDWHIGHYVKILMDEIFGEDNFRNEIVWHYRTGNLSFQTFQRKHDVILFYAKSEDSYFEAQNIKEYYVQIYGPDKKLSMKGPNDGEDEFGEYKISQMDDVWNVSAVFTLSNEHQGYATQKPEALLQRVINASSKKGMIVADFFGGSGATSATANKLNRKFIHCDIGVNSIQTTRDRLKADGASFDVLEIKDGVSLYRNPVQTMDKIKSLIPGLKNEDSLTSFWEGAISDSKLGLIPVYVPNLMDSTTKLLDEGLMHRILHEAIPELSANVKKVIVYYVDIIDKEAIEKFIKEDDSTLVEIELRDLKEVLDDVVINDYAEFTVEQNTEDLLGGYKIIIDKFISDRVNGKILEFNQKALANSSEKKPYKPITISEDGLELIEFISIDTTASSGEWHSDSEIKIDKLGYVIVNGAKTKEFWDGTIKCEKKPLRIKIRNICGDESILEV